MLFLLGGMLTSCASLNKYKDSTEKQLSKLELPPNVSSNKLSKKRLKH